VRESKARRGSKVGKGGGNYGKWKLIKANQIKKGGEQARKRFATRTSTGVAWCGVVWCGERERTSFVHCITLLLVSAGVAIKDGVEGCGDAFWLGDREKERQVITTLSHLFTPQFSTAKHTNKKPLPAPTPNSKHQ